MHPIYSDSDLYFWCLYIFGKEIHRINIHFESLTNTHSIRSLYSDEFRTYFAWFCYGSSWGGKRIRDATNCILDSTYRLLLCCTS